MRHALTLLAATLALLGCAGTPPATPAGAGQPPLLLLGEVHDNPAVHARRLQALEQQLHAGARPALLMEQFDRERQADIDRLLQRPAGEDDARLVTQLEALAGPQAGGWDWALYRPVLRLALAYRLPLVAANVSRADSRLVMRNGLAASGFEARVPADIQQAQAALIEASHCGQLEAAQAGRMALAQVARDQFMARQLAQHAGRGAVLLAGNGHVRRDLGVPRWLPPALQSRARVVGYLEAGDPLATAYDEVVLAPPMPRVDPCAGLRAPAVPG